MSLDQKIGYKTSLEAERVEWRAETDHKKQYHQRSVKTIHALKWRARNSVSRCFLVRVLVHWYWVILSFSELLRSLPNCQLAFAHPLQFTRARLLTLKIISIKEYEILR